MAGQPSEGPQPGMLGSERAQPGGTMQSWEAWQGVEHVLRHGARQVRNLEQRLQGGRDAQRGVRVRGYQVDPAPDGLVAYPRNWVLHAGALLMGVDESVTAQEADMLDGLGLDGLKDFKDVQGKAFDTADDRFPPGPARTFPEIGNSWRRAHGLDPADSRSPQEVGIEPGTRLLAVRTRSPSQSESAR
ncbi:hypothetical protein [Streptomyces sp. NPDC007083]|uniref:hypothetical protein n=1 Tax=unclassified Streptomyces TaxID=2593676 RepID=UPI0034052D10